MFSDSTSKCMSPAPCWSPRLQSFNKNDCRVCSEANQESCVGMRFRLQSPPLQRAGVDFYNDFQELFLWLSIIFHMISIWFSYDFYRLDNLFGCFLPLFARLRCDTRLPPLCQQARCRSSWPRCRCLQADGMRKKLQERMLKFHRFFL